MRRLEARVALVPGAARGIGRATAERLANEGAAVAVTHVQDEAGEQAAAVICDGGCDALYPHLGVTDEANWRAAVERVLTERGRLDVLVNNAGMGDVATIEETSLADADAPIFSTARPGVVMDCHTFVSAMIEQPRAER